MKNINAIKVGNVVNISIDGKLYKKNCGSSKEADELFKTVLRAKADPSEANIKAVRSLINEKIRVAYLAGLETDPDLGEVFLAGFNTPIPLTLVEVIKEYHDNQYPIEPIINFWKLLMTNPDVRVRSSLFEFIKTHDFVLTDSGYMVVYKAVYYKDDEKVEDDLPEFVSKQYLHVKKDWGCSPNKYVVYRDLSDRALYITKYKTAENWDEKERNVEILGKLGDLFESIFDGSEENRVPIFTDMHSRTMRIELGKPVHMPRTQCDGDPAKECSYGLHCGATKYVEWYANNNSEILVCFVNPAHVIAVPDYDKSKMRVCEYFPYAMATYTDGKIDIIEEKYFETDYQAYEKQELEAAVARIQANEIPYAAARKAEEDGRPLAELQKIIETRLVDLNDLL